MAAAAVDVEIPLADAVRALRRELQEAIRRGEGEELQFALGPIELELQLSVSKETGGEAGVAFWVITIGGKASRNRAETHTVKLSLTPVTPSGASVLVADELPKRPD
jgi:Trypsin-co-occurring domain 2